MLNEDVMGRTNNCNAQNNISMYNMAMSGIKILMCPSHKQFVKVHTELVHDEVQWWVFMITDVNFQGQNMKFLDQTN